jgi:Mg-chelatase subunit ChlD
MTKENFTAIAVIADASRSMASLTSDTIGSFNIFLNEQKANPAEAAFTLCIFNSEHRLAHDFTRLHSVAELTRETYRCSGSTALLDAMGATIDSLGARLAAMPEEERPSKVIVLVITDGEENCSRNYTLEQIKAKVEHQRDTYSWEFVFIGANIDAISTGTSMGFASHNSVAYTSDSIGTKQLYSSVSSNMNSYRTTVGPAQVDFFAQTGETPTSAPVVTPVSPAVNSFDPGHALPTNK